MDLIPGLPNDIARQCLVRVHCTQLSTMSSLSKAWKFELQSREFWRHRKQLCNNKQLILLKCRRDIIYKLIVVEPETSIWSELPPIPEFPNGVPETFNFIIASFKWGFVVMGAFSKHYEDKTPFCNNVFVFDYLTATWQRGADMPEGQLSVYRCTSDRDRMVYVLCEQNGYTKCIMVYDVLKDKWTSRIDTGEHGGNCGMGSMRRMIYQSGKIHFLDEWIQGGHDNDKRVFNVSTWKWDPPEVDFLDCHGFDICLSDDGEWYSCRVSRSFATLLTYKDFTWKEIGHVPINEDEDFDFMTTWKSKLMVIWGRWQEKENRIVWDYNSRRFKARVLDLKNHKWTTLDTPKEFTGRVEAGCCLEI